MKHDFVLTTPRLTLRPFKNTDAPTVASIASHPQVANHLLSIPQPYTQELAGHWIHSISSSASPHYIWAITLTNNKALIGSIGLHDVNLTHKKAEIGYWIAHPQHNKGFATEAAQSVTHFAFNSLNLNRIYATTDPGNTPSSAVLKKLNFSLEGILHQNYFTNNSFRDAALYALLKKNTP